MLYIISFFISLICFDKFAIYIKISTNLFKFNLYSSDVSLLAKKNIYSGEYYQYIFITLILHPYFHQLRQRNPQFHPERETRTHTRHHDRRRTDHHGNLINSNKKICKATTSALLHIADATESTCYN